MDKLKDSLKDIKPIVEIPDNSLIYLVLLAMFIIILIIATYYIYKKFTTKNNTQKLAIQKLKQLNFNDAKSVAYDWSKYSYIIKNDDNCQAIKEIEDVLLQYKYKKQVGVLEEEIINKIKELVNV